MAQGDVEIAPVFRFWRTLDAARPVGGRLPEAWADIIKRDPLMRSVVMVIDLVFGARFSIRISSRPITQKSKVDGSDRSTVPVLMSEPKISNNYKLGNGVSAARTVSITLDARIVRPMDIIRSGVPLAGLGEVSLQVDGADYEDRYVLIRGQMSGGVSFGAVRDEQNDSEVVRVQIVDPRQSMNTRLPPWVIDQDRFPNAHQTALGGRIPIVINRYERIPAVRTNDVHPRRFTFAEGRSWDVSTSGGVMVNGIVKTSTDGQYKWTLVQANDAFGVPYSAIEFTNAGTTWEDSDSVHVTATSTDSGKLNPAQAIRRVLEDYSAFGADGVNAQLFSDAESRMSGLDVNVLVNAAGGGSGTNVLNWIESGFLKSFPMLSMAWDRGTYGPIFTNRTSDPVAHFIEGTFPIVDRATLVSETDDAAIVNEFVLRYDYDTVQGVFRKVKTRNPSNSAICAASRQHIGPREADPIESVYIKADATADFTLDWQVEHLAVPSYLLRYDAFPSVLLFYRRGDPCTLTSPDFGLVQEKATIQNIEYVRGKVEITFRVWLRLMDFGGGAQSFELTG